MSVPEAEPLQLSWRDHAYKKSSGSSRTSFSARSRLWLDTKPRRPHISAPSDFRHLNSVSFQHSLQSPSLVQSQESFPNRTESFRPLELKIYTALEKEVSPIQPHLNDMRSMTPLPLAILTNHYPNDNESPHQRSYSSMSFHVPRKQIMNSPSPIAPEETPPKIPPKAQGRSRAYTAPHVDVIKERVARALMEVEQLQKQIDEVIERQTLYRGSRPSTSHSMTRAAPGDPYPWHANHAPLDLTEFGLDPMPSIPALPPSAPSFAERLNADLDRPRTASMKAPACVSISPRTSRDPSPALQHSPPALSVERWPPPPPLPLILRPPLRKKKSFSRVSTWLFPEPEHGSDMGLESITNQPRPVRCNGSFYQCVTPGSDLDRQSIGSFDTASTWDTDDGNRTVPTTWSPESTPAVKTLEKPSIDRTATFGKGNMRPHLRSVGVAM